MDPSLKTWKKELVCDRCKRWASGLTLIQPGIDWNGFWSPSDLVGKKICYTCIQKIFRQGPYRTDIFPTRRVLAESILLLSTAIILIAALATSHYRLISGLVFLGSLGIVSIEIWLREQVHGGWPSTRRKNRENWKAWEAWRRKHPEPLVSTGTMFDTQGA